MQLHSQWISFPNTFQCLNDLRFPRHFFDSTCVRLIEMHAFADASDMAYVAAVQWRSIKKSGRIIFRLLCAKSKVASTSKQIIPRLELCSALFATNLFTRLKKDLSCSEIPTFIRTDAEIVLASFINQKKEEIFAAKLTQNQSFSNGIMSHPKTIQQILFYAVIM